MNPKTLNLQMIRDMYAEIAALSIPITYAIVQQKMDGEGVYDIFRLSSGSYLQHNNRVYRKS